MRINMIRQIQAFNDRLLSNPLSSGQIALWYGLLYVNNKCAWIEWFTAPNLTLEALCGLSRQGINKARNVLKQEGLIEFRSNGTKAASYRLSVLYDESTTSNSVQDSIQGSVQAGLQESVQDSIQGSVQESSALNKQNKTKQKPLSKASKLPASAESDFGLLWQLYPRKKGKKVAYKAYCKAIIAGITNKQIQDAIVAYKREIKVQHIPEDKVAYGSTFFSQERWEDEFSSKNAQSNGNTQTQKPDYVQVDDVWRED